RAVDGGRHRGRSPRRRCAGRLAHASARGPSAGRVRLAHPSRQRRSPMTDAFAAAGYGARPVGFGRRAAIVVVDFQLGFTGGVSPMAQSPHVGAAVARAATVLDEARALGVPVLHTYVAYRGDWELGYWKAAGSL